MASDFHESFDNGVGALGHAWGNLDTSVPGQVTVNEGGALMEWAGGAWDGHGYGTYEITAQMHGAYEPGAALMLWPSDDKWPGQEIDVVETAVDGSGTLYGNVHWNADGRDAFHYVLYDDGVDPRGLHTFAVDWQRDHIAFSVDGVEQGRFTDHVPVAAEDGGTNAVFGALANNPNTSVTIYDMRYTPLDGGAPDPDPVVAPAPAPAPSGGGGTDWAHVAAVVQDFHDTHGWWASYDEIVAMGDVSAPADPPPTPPPADSGSGDVDWNALAAQAAANFEATGHWFI